MQSKLVTACRVYFLVWGTVCGAWPGMASDAGAQEVSADGTVTYSIPIELPAGRAGMNPSFSLAYNSNAGNGTVNGIAGIGWVLGGLPAISRLSAGDNGVLYDADDLFVGPSGRLVDVSGTRTLYHSEGTDWTASAPLAWPWVDSQRPSMWMAAQPFAPSSDTMCSARRARRIK